MSTTIQTKLQQHTKRTPTCHKCQPGDDLCHWPTAIRVHWTRCSARSGVDTGPGACPSRMCAMGSTTATITRTSRTADRNSSGLDDCPTTSPVVIQHRSVCDHRGCLPSLIMFTLWSRVAHRKRSSRLHYIPNHSLDVVAITCTDPAQDLCTYLPSQNSSSIVPPSTATSSKCNQFRPMKMKQN